MLQSEIDYVIKMAPMNNKNDVLSHANLMMCYLCDCFEFPGMAETGPFSSSSV